MRKGVLADDGFVELHWEAGHGADAARDGHQLGGVDACGPWHDVAAYLHGHDDLFEGSVARALA